MPQFWLNFSFGVGLYVFATVPRPQRSMNETEFAAQRPQVGDRRRARTG